VIGFFGCELPFPPSTNRLWRQFRGRTIKSAVYRDWIKEAALRVGVVETIRGPFEVTFHAVRPDLRRRDLDNLTKASMDCLTQCKVIEDDSLCQSLTIKWMPGTIKGGKLTAWVRAIDQSS